MSLRSEDFIRRNELTQFYYDTLVRQDVKNLTPKSFQHQFRLGVVLASVAIVLVAPNLMKGFKALYRGGPSTINPGMLEQAKMDGEFFNEVAPMLRRWLATVQELNISEWTRSITL
eukprot:TRINITY_DN2544_c0_g1_i1.p2 TRINITY_DN2544_c0_g1~~TRINITY_DN2544_c0_g1_i1.p2  ORF type:complete len:116 (-),score=30.34 TRINITY_DN2544_c0_g1_i1:176-523(-)